MSNYTDEIGWDLLSYLRLPNSTTVPSADMNARSVQEILYHLVEVLNQFNSPERLIEIAEQIHADRLAVNADKETVVAAKNFVEGAEVAVEADKDTVEADTAIVEAKTLDVTTKAAQVALNTHNVQQNADDVEDMHTDIQTIQGDVTGKYNLCSQYKTAAETAKANAETAAQTAVIYGQKATMSESNILRYKEEIETLSKTILAAKEAIDSFNQYYEKSILLGEQFVDFCFGGISNLPSNIYNWTATFIQYIAKRNFHGLCIPVQHIQTSMDGVKFWYNSNQPTGWEQPISNMTAATVKATAIAESYTLMDLDEINHLCTVLGMRCFISPQAGLYEDVFCVETDDWTALDDNKYYGIVFGMANMPEGTDPQSMDKLSEWCICATQTEVTTAHNLGYYPVIQGVESETSMRNYDWLHGSIHTMDVTLAPAYRKWAFEELQWQRAILPLTITRQPENVSVTEGGWAQFFCHANGTQVSYQWYGYSAVIGEWYQLTGETNEMLQIRAGETMSGNQYKCIVTDFAGNTATSNSATLTIVSQWNMLLDINGIAASGATTIVNAGALGTAYNWDFSDNISYHKSHGNLILDGGYVTCLIPANEEMDVELRAAPDWTLDGVIFAGYEDGTSAGITWNADARKIEVITPDATNIEVSTGVKYFIDSSINGKIRISKPDNTSVRLTFLNKYDSRGENLWAEYNINPISYQFSGVGNILVSAKSYMANDIT